MKSKQQMTLRGMFYWFFLLCVYLTILPVRASIQQAFQSPESIRSDFLLYAACWIVLLLHYVYLRQMLPVLVHAGAPALAVLACLFFGVRTKDVLTPTILAALWLGALASFPISVAKSIEFDFGKESNLLGYVCLNISISMAIVLPLCLLLYAIRVRRMPPPIMPPFVFAALLSSWCGLYQSIMTSGRFRNSKFLGMSSRVLVTSGLLAAIIGPIAYWGFSRSYGLYLFPPRYSPMIGLPVALAFGAIAYWGEHRQGECSTSDTPAGERS